MELQCDIITPYKSGVKISIVPILCRLVNNEEDLSLLFGLRDDFINLLHCDEEDCLRVVIH